MPMWRNQMALKLFARKFGYARSDNKEFFRLVERLQRAKALKVQQSGFNGHSLKHHKIVSVKDWDAVKAVFGIPREIMKPKRHRHHITIYEFTCAKPELPCSSRRTLKRQGMVCAFPGTCNQKRFKSGEIENA